MSDSSVTSLNQMHIPPTDQVNRQAVVYIHHGIDMRLRPVSLHLLPALDHRFTFIMSDHQHVMVGLSE